MAMSKRNTEAPKCVNCKDRPPVSWDSAGRSGLCAVCMAILRQREEKRR